MTAAEREAFEAKAIETARFLAQHPDYLDDMVANNWPSPLQAWMESMGYAFIERGAPAQGGKRTFEYWTPSGDLEVSEIALS